MVSRIQGADPGLVVDMEAMVGGVSLASPVMVASGCGGDGRTLAGFGSLDAVGAFVTASVTRDPTPGEPLPRLAESPSGLVIANGAPGGGIDGFLATELPWLLQHDVRPIVSIAGRTLGEFAELARRVGDTPGVAGIEVNLSLGYARDPVLGARAVGVVRREAAPGVPVLAKLWSGVGSAVEMAAAVSSGADAVVLTGSQPALVLDPRTLRPLLGAGTGELCGPAVRPLGLYSVWEVRRALPDATLIGAGGIRDGADALAYLAAGADAVQVGTALLSDPGAAQRIAAELAAELASRGLRSPAAARGLAHREAGGRAGHAGARAEAADPRGED